MAAFELFGITIYWYGIMYLLAFVAAYIFLYSIGRSKIYQHNKKIQLLLTKYLDDCLFYAILWVIIWWRLWYVLIYNPSYFLLKPWEVAYIWQGGMSFLWGLLGVVIACLYIKKKFKLSRKDWRLFGDLAFAIAPLGIAFGRLWNFLNQELYGKIISQSFIDQFPHLTSFFINTKIFYIYPQVDNFLRVNNNLIELSLQWLILLILLQTIYRRNVKKWLLFPWLLGGVFLVYYSIVRFWTDFLRDSVSHDYLGFFTKTQYLLVLLFFVWVLLICYAFKNKTKKTLETIYS